MFLYKIWVCPKYKLLKMYHDLGRCLDNSRVIEQLALVQGVRGIVVLKFLSTFQIECNLWISSNWCTHVQVTESSRPFAWRTSKVIEQVVPSTCVIVSNQSFCKATSIDFKLKLLVNQFWSLEVLLKIYYACSSWLLAWKAYVVIKQMEPSTFETICPLISS